MSVAFYFGGHRPPLQLIRLLDLACKTALPRPSVFTNGTRRGPQRHQSHHRFDEEERPLGLRDGERWFSPEAAKRRRPTDYFRARNCLAVSNAGCFKRPARCGISLG